MPQPKPSEVKSQKSEEAVGKATALKKANSEAAQTLASHFGPERWKRIIQQCSNHAMRASAIETLAGKMTATRKEWHPDNAALALAAAAIGFLCAIGSTASADDQAAYEAALKPL